MYDGDKLVVLGAFEAQMTAITPLSVLEVGEDHR